MYQFYSLPTWIQISKDFCEGTPPQLSDDLLSYLISHEHIQDLKVMSAIGQRLSDHLHTLTPLQENPNEYFEQFLNLYESLVEIALEELPQKPYCHTSCSNCCYQPIKASKIEADFIHKNLIHKINQDILHKQVNVLKNDLENISVWKIQLMRTEQACPLLDQESGKCTIYEQRPLACRNYFALNTDKFCAEDPSTITDEAEQKQARIIRLLEPAILSSALNIIDQNGKNSKWLAELLFENGGEDYPLPI